MEDVRGSREVLEEGTRMPSFIWVMVAGCVLILQTGSITIL
jgi:hypothetical protein